MAFLVSQQASERAVGQEVFSRKSHDTGYVLPEKHNYNMFYIYFIYSDSMKLEYM